MLLGANNAFTSEIGKGTNQITGENSVNFSTIARDYKDKGRSWVIIGDENYGEGSSREHAAMSPRFLGAKAVIVKSFARIHETNLKKQGVLALTFKNADDFEKVKEKDVVSIKGLKHFAPGKYLTLELKHDDGSTDSLELVHTFNDEQIKWFKAGSALNLLRSL
jgi:aconitate hydratase